MPDVLRALSIFGVKPFGYQVEDLHPAVFQFIPAEKNPVCSDTIASCRSRHRPCAFIEKVLRERCYFRFCIRQTQASGGSAWSEPKQPVTSEIISKYGSTAETNSLAVRRGGPISLGAPLAFPVSVNQRPPASRWINTFSANRLRFLPPPTVWKQPRSNTKPKGMSGRVVFRKSATRKVHFTVELSAFFRFYVEFHGGESGEIF